MFYICMTLVSESKIDFVMVFLLIYNIDCVKTADYQAGYVFYNRGLL